MRNHLLGWVATCRVCVHQLLDVMIVKCLIKASLFMLFRLLLKNEQLRAGVDMVAKKLEGFKNVMSVFSQQYPLLMLMCGTAIMTAYVRLIWMNRTYERMLLWFVGFAKRKGLDKVMTPEFLSFVIGLMALVVIEIQSIIVLIFVCSVFATLVYIVVVTYGKDRSGLTEGVFICFFTSALAYALMVLYLHALACFFVVGIALAAKVTNW